MHKPIVKEVKGAKNHDIVFDAFFFFLFMHTVLAEMQVWRKKYVYKTGRTQRRANVL